MKKIIFFICFFSSFLSYAQENYFIVTAYYSPLPNQKMYMRGNYENDMILNGRGTHGASGKGVFEWMLAAPKWYDFGTKIYLDGYGVGVVEDRGWAIVSAGNRGYEHDRIDIWMGYGDEGLKRALTWGRRKVKGYVISDETEITLDIQTFPIANKIYVSKAFGKKEKIYTPPVSSQKKVSIFEQVVYKNSNISLILELEKIFQELGYISETQGEYNNTFIDMIYSFQKEQGIVQSPYDSGAGYFGPKTRAALEKKYIEFNTLKSHVSQLEKDIQNISEKIQQKEREIQDEISENISQIPSIKMYDSGVHIRYLQNILKDFGYFHEKDTAIFGPITKDALIQYQLDSGIIGSKSQRDAGVFGPMTRWILEKEFSQKKIQEDVEILELKNIQTKKEKEKLLVLEKIEKNKNSFSE